MKQTDAAHIRNISGDITPEIVKKAYRDAAKRYHPDVNPAGEDMIKMVRAADETRKDFTGNLSDDAPASGTTYPEALNEAFNAIIGTPLSIEVCGAWLWISGETFAYRTLLRTYNFRWAPKKKQWYFRPEDWTSRNRKEMSMDDIREKHGSHRPKRTRQQINDEESVA